MIKASLAGGLGVLVRYVLYILIPSTFIALLLINLLGTFLISVTEKMSNTNKLIIQSGFLGGFTTLSSLFILSREAFAPVIINLALCYMIYGFGQWVINHD